MPVTQYERGHALQSMGLITQGWGFTYADNLIALAGGGQTGATAITAGVNRVVTVGTAADSVMLPVAYGGQRVVIINGHASNAVQIFANSAGTDTINGTAGSTGISLAAGKTIELCSLPARWFGNLSA
jgi:hypothetical protein